MTKGKNYTELFEERDNLMDDLDEMPGIKKRIVYYMCPFCGGEPMRLIDGGTVECSECGATAPTEEWNNRIGNYNK